MRFLKKSFINIFPKHSSNFHLLNKMIHKNFKSPFFQPNEKLWIDLPEKIDLLISRLNIVLTLL